MTVEKIVEVKLEYEIPVGRVVFDIMPVLGCNQSIPRGTKEFEGLTVASYFYSKNGDFKYHLVCSGTKTDPSQTGLDKAYSFRLQRIDEGEITDSLEAQVKSIIKKIPPSIVF